MKVLFIGGTGTISSACSRLAVERGIEVFHLNRGQRDPGLSKSVTLLKGDIRNRNEAESLLKPHKFDVVADFIAFTPDQIRQDIALFGSRTSQFVFISSASAYEKPGTEYLITESTPLRNPYWEYSRNKIACEELLTETWRTTGFPGTIVRPSYTYDEHTIPGGAGWGWTLIDRMRKGRKTLVHGDGSSLWTMTHNSDFAKGFVGLLGNPQALGHAFHITSDEVLTWDQLYRTMAAAAGVESIEIVHAPSDLIARIDKDMGGSLLGDKAWSNVMDNSKIRRFVPGFLATVPFREGIRRSIAWFDADKSRQIVDAKVDASIDRIIGAMGGV